MTMGPEDFSGNIIGKGENDGYQQFRLFSKWLLVYTSILSPNKALFFTCLQYKSFENTVGKGEIARNSVFYPSGELSAIFIDLKLSSAKYVSLEESKICRYGKG